MGERGCQVRSARTLPTRYYRFFFLRFVWNVVGLFLFPSLSLSFGSSSGHFLRLLCALVLTLVLISLDLRSNFDSIIEQAVASRQKGGTTGGTSGNTTTQQTVHNNVSNVNTQSQQQQHMAAAGISLQQQQQQQQQLEQTDAHFLQYRLNELERRDKDKDGMLSLLRSRVEQYEKENAKLKREAKDATAGGGQSGRIATAQNHQQQQEMVTAMTSYANTSAAHHVAAAEIREMRKEVGKLRNLLGFKDEELQEAQEREENARRRSRREKQELMNEIYGLREQVKKKESEFEERKLQKKKRSEEETGTGEENDAKRRKQNVESVGGLSVSDAIKRFNNNNVNDHEHSHAVAANAAGATYPRTQQRQQQNKNLETTKMTALTTTTTTTTTTTKTFKDVSDWRPMLPKAPKGLFDQVTMTASAFYHYRGISNNNNADNQRGTSSKKFAFFLDSFTKRDALLFLGFHTQAIEKGAMLASLRKKKSHNNSKKIGSGLSDIEEGWEYHSAAIGRALASVFLDDEEHGDDEKYPDDAAKNKSFRNDSMNEIFCNANFLITLLEALKSVAAFDGDKELNPARNEFADDNARDELAPSVARLLLVLLKNDQACCRRVIEARRRNVLRSLSTSQLSPRDGATEDDQDDDSEEEEDMMITDKAAVATTTTTNFKCDEKRKNLRRIINGSEFDMASACTGSFAGGSLVPHPLSTTGRVFVHTKVQVPREDYVTTASKSASKLKTKKSDASSIAPSRSATTVVDEKFDAVAIIVDCLRRCIGARAWEATAPLLDALTWLSSFAASEFINGRDIVGSRILPGSELMMTMVASRRTVPTAKAKTREEEMPSSGVISGATTAMQQQTTITCWLNYCLKPIAPQETRTACLSLIMTLSTCKSFQDALNEYAVLSDVVSVLRNEIPSASTNIMEIATKQDQNAAYMNYTCSRSRELVDLSLRVLAAFAHLDWKGWPRVVRKENVLAAAANTALWEMTIQKTNLKISKSSKGAPVSGISARILRYALIMIAHILSMTETQELAMRMLAENANLNRMMARCARAAVEHGPAQVRIGAFVMKCVEKAARTHYY